MREHFKDYMGPSLARIRKASLWLPALCLLASLVACKEQIIHNLDESEANRLLTRLHQSDVIGEKVKQPDGRWGISVDKDAALAAIKQLNDARMFNDRGANKSENPTLVTSREDQKFRYERSLSGEIESTLASLSGVLAARVHLNLPEVDPILGHRLAASRGSGSVLLIIETDIKIAADEIRGLVSAAAGIAKEAIVVVISVDPSQHKTKPQSAAALPINTSKAQLGAETLLREGNSSQQLSFISGIKQYLPYVAAVLLILGLMVLALSYRYWNRPKSALPNILNASSHDPLQNLVM